MRLSVVWVYGSFDARTASRKKSLISSRIRNRYRGDGSELNAGRDSPAARSQAVLYKYSFNSHKQSARVYFDSDSKIIT